MIFARRVAVVVITALGLLVFLRARSPTYHSTLHELSQSVGLGDLVEDEEDQQELTKPQQPREPFKVTSQNHQNDTIDFQTPALPIGVLKPARQPYTRGLVIGRLTSENTTWLDSYLPTDPTLTPYLYLVDDNSATLRTSVNKGHEANVYLTYIIDNYDVLPDISIFMHPHQLAWHTPELLNHDAIELLRRLSSDRVIREGYVNLRCNWDPGCPQRLKPGATYTDTFKREEIATAHAWAEMFPNDPIPEVLGAPCCAQFAVARESIKSRSQKDYERYRSWLLRTKESDWISGRVFEYLWQKIFANETKLCPDARACYCDGYGICFTSSETFETWFENHHYWSKATKELETWEEQSRIIDALGDWKKIDEMKLDIPVPGRNRELKSEIDERFDLLATMRTEALENGTDPETRATVAGRVWRAGDGY